MLISVQSSSVAKSSKKQKSKAGKKLAFSKFASNTNEGSSSESNEDDVICDDSSEDSSENFSDFDHEIAIIPQISHYVVKFDDKRLLHFVGQILTDKDEDDDYEVLFLRRYPKCNGFVEPAVDDIHSVFSSDVVMVLPSPCNGTTKRTEGIKKFAVDLSTFNL